MRQELHELLEHALAECIADVLLLVLGARDGDGFREYAVVPPSDGRGEEGKLVVAHAGDLLGVLAHARLVGVDDRQPELGVRALQLPWDVTVQAVVVQDHVEVAAAPVRVLADGNVATVRVAVQGRASPEYHLIEYARERGGYLVAVDAV